MRESIGQMSSVEDDDGSPVCSFLNTRAYFCSIQWRNSGIPIVIDLMKLYSITKEKGFNV